MSLDKQTVSFPFTGGIDAKTAPVHAQPPALLSLINGVFNKAGEISKRPGFDALSQVTYVNGSDETRDTYNVFTFDDRLIGIGTYITGSSKYSVIHAYDTAQAKWVSVVPNNTGLSVYHPILTRVRTYDVSFRSRLAYDDVPNPPKFFYDVGYAAGYYIVCCHHEDPTTKRSLAAIYSIADQAWPLIIDGFPADVAGSRPRCLSFSDRYLSVVWRSNAGNILYCSSYDTTGGSFTSSSLQLANDSSVIYTARKTSAGGVAAYVDTSGDIGVVKFSRTAVTATAAKHTPPAAIVDIGIGSDGDGLVYVVYSTAAKVYCRGYKSDLTVQFAETEFTYSAASIPGVKKIVASGDDLQSICYTQFEVPDAADPSLSHIFFDTMAAAGGGGACSRVSHGHTILSALLPGSSYVTQHMLDGEQTPYLTRYNSYGDARFLEYSGIDSVEYLANGHKYRSSVAAISTNKFAVIVPYIYGLEANLTDTRIAGKIVEFAQVLNSTTYTHSDDLHVHAVRYGDVCVIGGGMPLVYDGDRLAQSAPYIAPGFFSLASAGAGSLVAGETYMVKLVYSYFDINGNKYESPPSAAKSITIGGGSSSINITINDNTGNLGQYIQIDAYRTLASGDVYYFAGSTNPYSAGVTTLNIGDSDATISANKTLYTTGGVLENGLPQEARLPIVRQNRVFMITGKDSVVYSKERIDGVGVSFPAEFRIKFDLKHGDLTGLADLDGRVVVFAERGIWYFDGAGPNELGQGSFTDIRDVVAPVGNKEGCQPCVTDIGAFFVSSRGIELLGRDMSVSPVGLPVSPLISGNITSIVAWPSRSEVWFFADSGYGAIYNTIFQTWSLTSGLSAKNAVLWRGSNIAMTPIGRGDVWVSGSNFKDNSVANTLTIDTTWIAIDGRQGWQRVYDVKIIGTYKSAHTFRVDIYYDYIETIVETKTVTPTSDIELRFRPGRQKCQAIRFKISDTSPSGTAESFAISHLQIQVGVKGGLRRISAS